MVMNALRCECLKTMTNMLLSVCLVSVISVAAQGYALHKCCPRHQQLASDFKSCVNYRDKTFYNVSTSTTDVEWSIDPPDINNNTNLPWWFPQDADILDDDTLHPVSNRTSFLMGNFSLQITYGKPLPCSYQNTKLVTGNFDFLDDGSIVVYDDDESESNKTYSSITYCVDRVVDLRTMDASQDIHVVKICPCLKDHCIRKCCSPGNILKMFKDDPAKCVPRNVTEDWKPEGLDNTSGNTKNFTVLPGNTLTCTSDQIQVLLNPSAESKYKYSLARNGTIHVEKSGGKSEAGYREYCAEIIEFEDGVQSRNLLYCGEKPVIESLRIGGVVYGVLIVVGSIFLLATLVVYTVVPQLRNLHGKNLMAHTASFLVAYIALAAGQLNPHMPKTMCISIGFVIQFSSLAAFFWLNVMCIDISWTFSGLRPLQGSASVRERKKFIYYSCYAWGSTGLITLVTAIMEFTPAITRLKPGFGKTSCLFNGTSATMVYFYIPMALLLITNLGLFLYTAARIIAVRRQTAILHSPGSVAYNKEKQRLILYMKLFLLMGVTWVTDIISWAVGGPDYYWYLTDILNLLRAVFIFLIFCCKRTVFRLFTERCRKTFRLQSTTDQGGHCRKENTSTKNAVVVQHAGDVISDKTRKISNPITQETEINI